jgi:hypothetical protein
VVIYAVGLVLILIGEWRTASQQGRRLLLRVSVSLAIALAYMFTFGYIGFRQYQKQEAIKLEFRDSPYLSWWVQIRIKHDVAKFRDYLAALDIDVPTDVPPFQVHSGPTSASTNIATPAGLPTYRGGLSIGKDVIGKRSASTLVYGGYVIERLLVPQLNTENMVRLMLVHIGLQHYLNWSYWGGKQVDEDPLWAPASILWDIRDRFGKSFTDRLVANMLRSIVDSPNEVQAPKFDTYLCERLRLADKLTESESQRWPEIESILKQDGGGCKSAP